MDDKELDLLPVTLGDPSLQAHLRHLVGEVADDRDVVADLLQQPDHRHATLVDVVGPVGRAQVTRGTEGDEAASVPGPREGVERGREVLADPTDQEGELANLGVDLGRRLAHAQVVLGVARAHARDDPLAIEQPGQGARGDRQIGEGVLARDHVDLDAQGVERALAPGRGDGDLDRERELGQVEAEKHGLVGVGLGQHATRDEAGLAGREHQRAPVVVVDPRQPLARAGEVGVGRQPHRAKLAHRLEAGQALAQFLAAALLQREAVDLFAAVEHEAGEGLGEVDRAGDLLGELRIGQLHQPHLSEGGHVEGLRAVGLEQRDRAIGFGDPRHRRGVVGQLERRGQLDLGSGAGLVGLGLLALGARRRATAADGETQGEPEGQGRDTTKHRARHRRDRSSAAGLAHARGSTAGNDEYSRWRPLRPLRGRTSRGSSRSRRARRGSAGSRRCRGRRRHRRAARRRRRRRGPHCGADRPLRGVQ